MKIVSANLLNDIQAPIKHPFQKERIPVLAKDILKLCGDIPDVVYVCEGSNKENIGILAELLTMQVVDSPYLYSRHDEYAAFLVKPNRFQKTGSKFIEVEVKRSSKHGYIMLSADDIAMTGAHYPYRPFIDGAAKKTFTRSILSRISPEKAIVLGDHNNIRWMGSRKEFVKNGYSEVDFTLAKTPTPRYKGKIIPSWLPRVSLDVTYYKGIELKYSAYLNSEGSDHPLIYSHFASAS